MELCNSDPRLCVLLAILGGRWQDREKNPCTLSIRIELVISIHSNVKVSPACISHIKCNARLLVQNSAFCSKLRIEAEREPARAVGARWSLKGVTVQYFILF